MFFLNGRNNQQAKHLDIISLIVSGHRQQLINKTNRKEYLSPEEQKKAPQLSPKSVDSGRKGKTFLLASLLKKNTENRFGFASLTVEAALTLPVFFFCMIALLGVGRTYYSAIRFSSALTETAEEMGIAAYAGEFGDVSPLVGAAASTAYASARVLGRAGNAPGVKGQNLLLSAVLQDQDMIQLRLTYGIKSYSLQPIPTRTFLQVGCVRAWTGRRGSDGTPGQASSGEESDTVYVAENGVVYHTDPNCTHIHLSVSTVSLDEAKHRRNRYGARYHSCEKCGRYAQGNVYITTDGNRYHSSLDCPGLKRTVRQKHLDEVSHLRPCSKCSGG